MSLFVCSWLWGTKWKAAYAQRLFAALERNIAQDYRSVLITDQTSVTSVGADIVLPIEDADRSLLSQPGCLVRMRMFDPAFQARIGAVPGDRIVNIDVDAVVTGALDPLFDRHDEFTILQRVNQTNPCPFNGSLWMLRAGRRHDVFTDFSFEAYRARRVPVHAIPDDQGWLHHKFPNAAAWTAADGVYAFKKIGWPGITRIGDDQYRHALPGNARVVAFPGRDPGRYQWLGWVRQHWGGSMLITPDYAQENQRLHATDAVYGSEGHLWGYLIAGIAALEKCQTILDYGCGKGSLGKTLREHGRWVSDYDPAVPGANVSPKVPSDLVVCLDVLEHIEPDCLDDVIADLARLAGRRLFVVISTKLSKRKLADGRDTHLSLHPPEWWQAKVVQRGFVIVRVWHTGLQLWVALLTTPGAR
jgi:hypothetical protein